MTHPVRIDVLYGFVRLETVLRTLPDGSIESGCRVRTYDNKPSEPEHLVRDKTTWGTCRVFWS